MSVALLAEKSFWGWDKICFPHVSGTSVLLSVPQSHTTTNLSFSQLFWKFGPDQLFSTWHKRLRQLYFSITPTKLHYPFSYLMDYLTNIPQGAGNDWFLFLCIDIVKERTLACSMPKCLENSFPLIARATNFLHSTGLGLSTAFSPSYHSVPGTKAYSLAIILWSFPWLFPVHTLGIWGRSWLGGSGPAELLPRQLSCPSRASRPHTLRSSHSASMKHRGAYAGLVCLSALRSQSSPRPSQILVQLEIISGSREFTQLS